MGWLCGHSIALAETDFEDPTPIRHRLGRGWVPCRSESINGCRTIARAAQLRGFLVLHVAPWLLQRDVGMGPHRFASACQCEGCGDNKKLRESRMAGFLPPSAPPGSPIGRLGGAHSKLDIQTSPIHRVDNQHRTAAKTKADASDATHEPISSAIDTPTTNGRNGNAGSVGVQPFQIECSSGALTWSRSPGSLTNSLAATVQPRSASTAPRRRNSAFAL